MTGKEKAFEVYKKAYSLLDNTTPCKFDCGELCGKACCSNNSNFAQNSGMLLLPYEKDYIFSLGKTSFSFENSNDGTYLICRGNCERNFRPISCRIFPFYPSFTEDNNFVCRADIRAISVCPLIISKKFKRQNVYFLRNFKKSIKVLLSHEEIKKEILKTSEFTDSLYTLLHSIK